ncbi:XdhC family protein [Parasphingorhabdus sp.]|uniref:XdhC family protein n=1 Tax=Parasphingorhabdus sp. TaxID=2709688 RepID=UPI003D2E5CB3
MSYFEHPVSVLEKFLDLTAQGQAVALAILVGIEGGARRELGSLMAISANGETFGSIVGGCIEAEVVTQAADALAQQIPKRLRYGNDSPIIDLRLPCDGAIDILIQPGLNVSKVQQWYTKLTNRQPVMVGFNEYDVVEIVSAEKLQDPTGPLHYIGYEPETTLRIAGTGIECVALVELAMKVGFRVVLQSTNPKDLPDFGLTNRLLFQQLKGHSTPLICPDDRWTALIVMLHDIEWEVGLLKDALKGDCFYIGTVGSKANRWKRDRKLGSLGVRWADLNRVYGPIGLIQSMRSPSTLAISILAQVIDVFRKRPEPLTL